MIENGPTSYFLIINKIYKDLLQKFFKTAREITNQKTWTELQITNKKEFTIKEMQKEMKVRLSSSLYQGICGKWSLEITAHNSPIAVHAFYASHQEVAFISSLESGLVL